jgi:glucan phosphorylase
MKIVSLLLSLCLASVALAEDPAELERLRHLWEKSISKEFDEKNKVYLKSLEKLQKKFTKANNLTAAVAVNAEMKKVEAIEPKQNLSSIDGAWFEIVNGKRYLKVIKGNYFVDETSRIGKCSVKNGILTIVRLDGANWELTLDPKNPDIMQAQSGSRSSRWERVQWKW